MVTVTGSNLAGVTRVTFDGHDGTGLEVESSTSLQVTTPALLSNGSVTVRAYAGTSSAGGHLKYTIDPPAMPTLTAVKPASVPLAGGTVTLSGTALATTRRVTFGSRTVTSVRVIDDATLEVVAPAMETAGPVDVRVRTAAGSTPKKSLSLNFGGVRTNPWERKQSGANAVDLHTPYAPSTTPCPLRTVDGSAVVQPLLSDSQDKLLDEATDLASSGAPDDAVTTPDWALQSALSAFGQLDQHGNTIITRTNMAKFLQEIADALAEQDVSGLRSDLEQQMVDALFGHANIPEDVDPETFYYYFADNLAGTPVLSAECQTSVLSDGMRLYHYGPYDDQGWFIDWDHKFVQLQGVDLWQDAIYPVPQPPGNAPAFYVTDETVGPFVNPVSLLTFTDPPEDDCVHDADQKTQWENMARRLIGVSVEIAGKAVAIGPLFSTVVDGLANTFPCYTVRPTLTHVIAADGHQLSASGGSFATSDDGTKVAITELQAGDNPDGPNQIVRRYTIAAGATGLTGPADQGVAINEGQYVAGQFGYQVGVPLAMSPDGRYVASCNTGHDPEVYDTAADSITYPPNIPYVGTPSCALATMDDDGILTFGALDSPAAHDGVTWTYQR